MALYHYKVNKSEIETIADVLTGLKAKGIISNRTWYAVNAQLNQMAGKNIPSKSEAGLTKEHFKKFLEFVKLEDKEYLIPPVAAAFFMGLSEKQLKELKKLDFYRDKIHVIVDPVKGLVERDIPVPREILKYIPNENTPMIPKNISAAMAMVKRALRVPRATIEAWRRSFLRMAAQKTSNTTDYLLLVGTISPDSPEAFEYLRKLYTLLLED